MMVYREQTSGESRRKVHRRYRRSGLASSRRGRLPVQWFVLMIPLCSGCSQPLDLDSSRLFQEAEKTFAAARSPEDFLRAAALDQEILDRGQISGAILYNQGNAFVRAGQRGRAIACYRQASRYRPRDPLLEANLSYVLGSQPLARRPVIEYLLFWQDWVSYPEKFCLAAVGVGITFLLAMAALFVRRQLLWRLVLLGLGVSFVLVSSAGYDWYCYEWKVHGVIVAKKTVVRKGNAESYEPALVAPIEEGTEFSLVEQRGNWLWIHLPGNQEGWIPNEAAVVY